MVTIRPFTAIRPTNDFFAKIATLPYDVLSSEEARELGKDNPYSYLHIDKAEIDLPADISPYDPKVYETAAKNLQLFLQKNWLTEDVAPAFYLYELTMNGRSQTGIVACTAIDDYETGVIKRHEYTRPEKELDRIRHIEACDADTSPIFLAYQGNSLVQTMITNWKKQHEPLADFTSFHDVTHRLWQIDDLEITEKLATTFQNQVSALYIADGHHRTASAVKVGQELRKKYPDAPAEAPFNYFLSVIFPKDELTIYDYNRLLNVPIPENFIQKVQQHFDVTQTSAGKPTSPKSFGMYLKGQWYALKAKTAIYSDDPVKGLDVSLLQDYIFAPLFDIQDVRTDQRIDFVGGIRGMAELEKQVDSGQWSIAFAVYPTTMDALFAVADADKIMPPKSTWFEPKLLSGLFLHDLKTKSLERSKIE